MSADLLTDDLLAGETADPRVSPGDNDGGDLLHRGGAAAVRPRWGPLLANEAANSSIDASSGDTGAGAADAPPARAFAILTSGGDAQGLAWAFFCGGRGFFCFFPADN